jgi:uroporphyrinogen III methyltransferase/synthase
MNGLSGRTVVVTRAPEQAGELSRLLRERGAVPVEIPTIEIVPPASWEEADRAIDRLPGYDWVVLTSANGVKWFLGRVKERRGDLACLRGVKICAVGPKTRELLTREGLTVDFVPTKYRAEALVEEAGEEAWRGKRILLPRAAEGRDVIPEAMKGFGAQLDLVTVYRTVPSPAGREKARALLQEGKADAITFTSGSTVTNFASLFEPGELPALLGPVAVVSIGPVTTEAAHAAGLRVDATADGATLPALVDALEKHFGTM